MATSYKTLYQDLLTATTVTSTYSVPGGVDAILGTVTFVNVSASTSSTIKMWQVPTAATAEGDAYVMLNTITLGPGERYVLNGPKTVGTSTTFKVQAGTASVVNCLIEGAEVGVPASAPAWGQAGARVYMTGTQSIPNGGSPTAVTFANEANTAGNYGFDIDAMHDTAVNPSRLTCVTPGTYVLAGMCEYASNATGLRVTGIRINGTDFLGSDERAAVSGDSTRCTVSAIATLAVGDYIELTAYQNSGGALNITNNGLGGPSLSAVRVGYQTNPNYLAPSMIHDHARPAWSGTATRTTSFTCPTDAKMLFVQLTNLGHANASAIWDMHIYLGTTSGGSELFSLGGNNGFIGYGGGTGTMYPFNGAYSIPVTPAMRGTTLYVTSYAPAGNYYLSGDIKITAM